MPKTLRHFTTTHFLERGRIFVIDFLTISLSRKCMYTSRWCYIIIIIIIIIITLFEEDNIFGRYASLTYGPQLTNI